MHALGAFGSSQGPFPDSQFWSILQILFGVMLKVNYKNGIPSTQEAFFSFLIQYFLLWKINDSSPIRCSRILPFPWCNYSKMSVQNSIYEMMNCFLGQLSLFSVSCKIYHWYFHCDLRKSPHHVCIVIVLYLAAFFGCGYFFNFKIGTAAITWNWTQLLFLLLQIVWASAVYPHSLCHGFRINEMRPVLVTDGSQVLYTSDI